MLQFVTQKESHEKLNKVAIAVAAAALATVAGAQEIHNWKSNSGDVWKNNRGNAGAMPAGHLRLQPLAAMAPSSLLLLLRPAPAPAAAPSSSSCCRSKPAPAPAPAVASKVTYAADAFFDFDKAVLKPEGKAKLDDLVGKVKGINLEVIIAVGHTDSVGTDAYNQKLSIKRSEAVKAYLVSKGIEKSRVYTEGKGEKQPVADNKTKEGRTKNRRVEIEVVGTRSQK
jgi:OOP family OmpA-OmpF porin